LFPKSVSEPARNQKFPKVLLRDLVGVGSYDTELTVSGDYKGTIDPKFNNVLFDRNNGPE
jgi:hypothetical protein